uniref:G-patch domain-containing protein n=1 Tax=Chlamydomonas leiostraca TaxID=1034604 RepID=A0A6T8WGS4_9CHLO|mmetsp:Transcript_831/g.2238  ORF Transcript_831/g.2238 Transcript_831/m.2238 type:complete len:331 (+) Transcript_831:223-1215(+)|eukprot:CAMPEP_0202860956 /NCGR_PEP_ID=MMETSP1391-20130828/2513_1 /ASSEMBLY_ACC=CAM_ASM_000867 /TAXON_ID=1034604 /ORGANISM="Chlamydomonas leiostraca, Strain SAG 11-49" /LENGTH=330 /DNA_ID=CAMNT_0049540249 /DNA_START=187 /DNA_END=1179 /DNA_ORIENTATION=-
MSLEEDGAGEDLDALLDKYAAEAAAQNARDAARAKAKTAPRSMAALRTQGLTTALPADNKGFKLLKAMGYQEGKGLGKDKSGIAQPLDVVIKPNRAGLGVDERARREKQAREEQLAEQQAKRARMAEGAADAFKSSAAESFAARKAQQTLRQAWNAAVHLEEQAAALASQQQGEGGSQQGKDASGRDVTLPGELQQLVYRVPEMWEHLAATGQLPDDLAAAFRSEEEEAGQDQGGSGPSGSNREVAARHGAGRGGPAGCGSSIGYHRSGAASTKLPEELAQERQPSVSEQLHTMLAFLRSKHQYCVFCGCAYSSAEELGEHCPGEAEDDH